MTAADILGESIIVENVFFHAGNRKTESRLTLKRFAAGCRKKRTTFYLALIVVVCNFIVDLIYSIVIQAICLK